MGSGDFVVNALQKAGKSFEAKQSRRPPLKALIDIVSESFGVSAKQLKSGSRRRAMVQARSVVAYVAVRRYGYKGFEVAEALASSCPSVSRNIEKGESILDNNKELKIEFPVT